MLNVTADLFRIAAMFQSDETTRYYLGGVFVEPHASGATLTATDGHVLISILDIDGHCDKPEIIQLSRDALKACKPARKDASPRYVHLHPDTGATAYVKIGDVPVAVSPGAIVDGTFPDYRRVIPAQPYERNASEPEYPAYAANVLSVFCDAARALQPNDKVAGFVLKPNGGAAAYVTFPCCEHAFGLAMPYRAEHTGTKLPAWHYAAAPLPKPAMVAA